MTPPTATDDLVAIISTTIHGQYSRAADDTARQMIDANAAHSIARVVATALTAAGIGDLRTERAKVVDEVRYKAEILPSDEESLMAKIAVADLNDVAKSDGDGEWLRMSAADFASIIAAVERTVMQGLAEKMQNLADHHEANSPAPSGDTWAAAARFAWSEADTR